MSPGRTQSIANYSSTFNLITWVLQVATILLVVMKLGMAHSTIGLRPDDWSVLAATLASIGNTVAVSIEATNDLGRSESTLSSAQLIVFEKSAYAGMILYVTSIATSKLSIVLFSYMLTYNASHRKMAAAVGAFVVAWSLSSILVSAFQCSSPYTWSILKGRCIAIIPFWTSFAVINIVTELGMIALPVMIIYPTRFNSWRKVVLIICFSLRVLVIAAGIVQLYYLHSPTAYDPMQSRTDFTLYSWTYVLTSEILQALSITTLCIPFVKPMLMALQSGMFQTGKLGLNMMGSLSDSEKASSSSETNNKRQRVGGVKFADLKTSKGSGSRPSGSLSETLTPSSSRDDGGEPKLGQFPQAESPQPNEHNRDSMNSIQLLNAWGMGKWFT